MGKFELSAEDQRIVALVRGYQDGKEENFDRIYSLCYPGVYYVAYRMIRDEYEAEDCAQEVFLNVSRNLKKLEEPQSFKKWLNRLTYHCCLDYIRSVRHTSTSGDSLEEMEPYNEPASSGEEMDERLIRQEKSRTVMDAVDELNLPVRTTVMLRFYTNLKEREIAEVMDVPVGTVKTRLKAAKKVLSMKLSGIRSIAPFFFVRLSALQQSGTLAVLHGAAPHGKAICRIAAGAVGAAAGVTAAVMLRGPVIRNLRIYEPEQFVNTQTLRWSVDAGKAAPVRSVTVEGLPSEIEFSGDEYSAPVTENGTYTVRVTDSMGRCAEQAVTITNIDNRCPEFISSEENGNSMILLFGDDLSGVSWERTSLLDRDGSEIGQENKDRSRNAVRIDKDRFPVSVYLEDKAGNYGSYEMDLSTVTMTAERR